ncbi:MAG: hypothetical protein ACREQZ_14100 [Woeseiaceae bacterium]
MLIVAAALFAIAAVGGVAMAYIHFRKDSNPPVPLAVLHGLLAATALVILILTVARFGATTATAWATGLFVVAALGGFFLVTYHVRGRRLPSPVVVIHALVAVAAFLLLLAGVASIA